MDTKSFLTGYLASMANLLMHRLAPTYEIDYSYHSAIDCCGSQILLMTNVGKIVVGINLGICLIDGILVVAADPKFNTQFRIRKSWCDISVLEKTHQLGLDWGEDDELNFYFKDLINFIDICEGIDYPATFNLQAKSTDKTFKTIK